MRLRQTVAFLLGTTVALLCASHSNAQLLHRKKKINKSTSADNNAQPDKVLYDRALADIQHGRHEVGRLGMQTLINTYPDSEYLAKAKLAIADSYYKEGGTADLLQAIQGYKDFIVFFPFLQEASYAQLQVANAHYQQMAKADRDRSESKAAEEEYQTFLTKYPHDPLAPKAEQRLRDVQELIAEGDYRIGYFYYVKGDKRAAAARLIGVAKRYPLYSKSDKVLWMLGDIFETSEHKEIASIYYGRIIRDYPLSKLAPEAKTKLVRFKVPVPQPDPQAVAWMTAQQNAPRPHDSFIKRPLALVRTGPHEEILASAKSGMPDLQPEADDSSATDILTGGNKSRIGGGAASGNTAVIETVTPGTPAPTAGTEGAQPADAGAPGASGTPASAADPNAAVAPASGAPGAGEPNSAQPNGGTSNAAAPVLEPTKPADTTSTAAAPNATEEKNTAAGTDANAATSTSASGDSTQNADGTKSDASQSSSDSSSQSGDSKHQKESSSKKRKGMKKLLPW